MPTTRSQKYIQQPFFQNKDSFKKYLNKFLPRIDEKGDNSETVMIVSQLCLNNPHFVSKTVWNKALENCRKLSRGSHMHVIKIMEFEELLQVFSPFKRQKYKNFIVFSSEMKNLLENQRLMVFTHKENHDYVIKYTKFIFETVLENRCICSQKIWDICTKKVLEIYNEQNSEKIRKEFYNLYKEFLRGKTLSIM